MVSSSPRVVRQNSVELKRKSLLASSIKPHRVAVNTVHHQQNCADVIQAPPAGNIPTASKYRKDNESGRFHLWAEIEQQFQQYQKTMQSSSRVQGTSDVGAAPRPGADLFGREGSSAIEASSVMSEAPADVSRSFSSIASIAHGGGSGNDYHTGDLASGFSESQSPTSRHFSTTSRIQETCRYHKDTGVVRAEPKGQGVSSHARAACRFHDHQRPARARSVDRGGDGRNHSGLNCEARESRRHGDKHGRSLTPDYHRRYEANAIGSSLPGNTGANSSASTIYTPVSINGQKNRNSHNLHTPSASEFAQGNSRRIGVCDPRQSNLTPSLHNSRACRYHAEPRDADKLFRHKSQDRRENLTSGKKMGYSFDSTAKVGSSNGYPTKSIMSSGFASTPSVGAWASPRNDGAQASPRYVPGRMDMNVAKDRLVVAETKPKAPIGNPSNEKPVQVSGGGGLMTSKRRLNESHVAAARQYSSPIASEGGVWA